MGGKGGRRGPTYFIFPIDGITSNLWSNGRVVFQGKGLKTGERMGPHITSKGKDNFMEEFTRPYKKREKEKKAGGK